MSVPSANVNLYRTRESPGRAGAASVTRSPTAAIAGAAENVVFRTVMPTLLPTVGNPSNVAPASGRIATDAEMVYLPAVRYRCWTCANCAGPGIFSPSPKSSVKRSGDALCLSIGFYVTVTTAVT